MDATTHQPQQPQQLPTTYARLVADAPAASFAAAARVDASCPLPQPGPGEVLVRMHWAGVNGGCETFRARAEHAFARHRTATEPYALGAEGSGVIVARGDGGVPASLPVGQAVAVNGASAFCEYSVAKAAFCTPVPGEPSAEAAALTLSAVTAAAALGPQEASPRGAAPRVPPGGAVVVTAAAGGAGHFAVQYARLYGAGRVVAVVGSGRKAKWLREELWPEVLRRSGAGSAGGGAAAAATLTNELVVIDASEFLPARGGTSSPEEEQALAATLRRACGEERGGADLVFEGVGGAVGRACLAALRPQGGLALQVGYISEYPHNAHDDQQQPDTTSGNAELFWQGLERDLGEGRRVTGRVWPRDPKTIARAKRRVFSDFYEKRVLVAQVHVPEGLRGVGDVPEAVERMLRGDHVGKFVVPLV
jgi:NADPH:quinone reductase-like Zn-dependent oxidoreductase